MVVHYLGVLGCRLPTDSDLVLVLDLLRANLNRR